MFRPSFLAACALPWVVLVPTAVLAAPSIEVNPGFRRLSKAETSMPVVLTLVGDNADRRLDIRISGTPGMRLPLELARQTKKQVILYTEPTTPITPDGWPLLEVREGGDLLHAESLQTTVYHPPHRLVGVVGGPPFSSPEAEGVLLDPRSLPERPRAYRGLDALMVYPGAWQAISEKGLEAMALWVEDGGVVVAPLLGRADRLRLDARHPFGPAATGATTEVRGLVWGLQVALAAPLGLSERAAEKMPIEPWDRIAFAEVPPQNEARLKAPFPGPGPDEPDPRRSTHVPVLSIHRRGHGAVCFLGFDPLGASLRDWKLRDRFLQTLYSARDGVLDRFLSPWPEAEARNLVLFRGERQPAIGWYFIFLLVYLVLLGPGDWWLVRRSGRPRLTWITFPLLVFLFCILAWDMGRGRIGTLEQREVTFVDFPPGGGGGHGLSFSGIYSDTNRALGLRPLPPRAEVDLFERESGGERLYLAGGKEEEMEQKMHIWAAHGYRALWRETKAALAGELGVREDGTSYAAVEQDLPAPPSFIAAFADRRLVRLRAGEAAGAAARYQAALDEAATWEELGAAIGQAWGGGVPWDFVAGLQTEAEREPCLIVLVPGPWPVLEVAGRLPRTSGFAIVRAPLVPREMPTEAPEAPEEDR